MVFNFTARVKRFSWIIIPLLLFSAYSYLPASGPSSIFNSPDETANYFFAKTIADKTELKVYEPFESLSKGRVHPRSAAVSGDFLVPESFHGLPVLYGLIAKLFSLKVVKFLTPFFAVLALLAWRKILADFFGTLAGTIGAAVLAIAPAFWYYADRSMFHNIPFVSFLIFFIFFLLSRPIFKFFEEKKKIISGFRHFLVFAADIFLAGVFLGLAWWTRTAEIAWTGILALSLIIIFRKTFRWRGILPFIFGLTVAFLPALLINKSLYGGFIQTGYGLITTAAPVFESLGAKNGPSAISAISDSFQAALNVIFPFGFHPRTALSNVLNYLIILPWWMAAASLISFFWFAYGCLNGKQEKENITYVILSAFVSVWLIVVYGSWVIHDNPDPNAVTLGISYNRYWLPIFAAESGLIGIAFAHFWEMLKPRFRFIFVILFAISAFLSFSAVFLSKGDGIFAIGKTLKGYETIKAQVLKLTQKNAVIITDRGDKIFFPDRKVIATPLDESVYHIIPDLGRQTRIFYYGTNISNDELKYLNNQKLVPYGLQFGRLYNFGRESLYGFVHL